MVWKRHLSLAIRDRSLYRQLGSSKCDNVRLFSRSRRLPQQPQPAIKDDDELDRIEEEAEMRQEVGRMTERLSQLTEESIEQGGKGARKAVEEAGFSEELKQRLEERIQESRFRSDNAAAFAEITLPVSCSVKDRFVG